jgi:hypothetical protein
MEKCISKNVKKLLQGKQYHCISENPRKEEKVYDRLFYCLETLYDYGWVRRDDIRKS